MKEGKLKALYIGLNMSSISPTIESISISLSIGFNLDFYGPGYVSNETLKKGLMTFIENNGPYDCIFVSQIILLYDKLENKEKYYDLFRRSHVMYFSKNQMAYIKEIAQEVNRQDCIKIIVFYSADYYNLKKEFLKRFFDNDYYIMTHGADFFELKEKLINLNKERFAASVTDDWYYFCHDNFQRIISLPHFIGESEFNWSPISERRYDWSILGVDYWARAEAKSNLKKHKIKFKRSKIKIGFSILDHLKFKPYSNIYFMQNFKNIFKNTLASSKCSFTCGSALKVPVRKYFEIPASGCMLVCLPCNGFENIGFINGVNCILTDPSDIMDVHNFLINEPEKVERIAALGRKLVWEKHSTYARANQIRKSIEVIKDGDFNGSSWENGDYIIKHKAIRRENA